jgi:hypothetical protein
MSAPEENVHVDEAKPVIKSNLKEIALAAKAAAAAENSKPPKHTEEETAQRKERQLNMLTSFADHLVKLTNEKSEAAAAKGYGWIKLAEYYLPGFDKIEANGEIVLVPRHPPEFTHWAGAESDPAANGTPIVMLLQGIREHTKDGPRLRPDFLVGGKTSLELAQEKLSPTTRLDCAFNPKTKSLIITAVWIEDDWAEFKARRQQQRQQRQPFFRNMGPRY